MIIEGAGGDGARSKKRYVPLDVRLFLADTVLSRGLAVCICRRAGQVDRRAAVQPRPRASSSRDKTSGERTRPRFFFALFCFGERRMSEDRASEVNLSEAARLARRSPERLRRLVAAGRIAGRQTATGRWYVDANSLDEFLARESETAPPGVTPGVADLARVVQRFHALSLGREELLNSIAAEAEAAAGSGNGQRAALCRDLATSLRDASHTWEPRRRTWVVRVPGAKPREIPPAPRA